MTLQERLCRARKEIFCNNALDTLCEKDKIKSGFKETMLGGNHSAWGQTYQIIMEERRQWERGVDFGSTTTKQ